MAVHRIKTYKLTFEGTDWADHEVHMKGINYGEFILLDSLSFSDEESINQANDLMVRKLVSWNLEMPSDPLDDDSPLIPVPRTIEGLRSVEPSFVIKMVNAWVEAVSGVADPLDQNSSGGEKFPVAQIPMETLSPSPMHSPMPNSLSTSAVPSTFSPASS